MKLIEVIANPYIALDAEGIPQGVVQMPGSASSHVGAREDMALSAKTGKSRFYFPPGKVKVAFTPEIAHSVRDGELIATNKDDAYICGVRKDFLEPDEALAREKQRALEYRRALLGPDATVGEIPREPDAEAAAWFAGPKDGEPSLPLANKLALSPTLTLNTES